MILFFKSMFGLPNSIIFKDCTYLFLERGKGREKEKEKTINVRKKHRLGVSYAP